MSPGTRPAAANIAAYKKPELKDYKLNEATVALIYNVYAQDLPVNEESFAKAVEQLRIRMALDQKFRDAATKEKIETFVADYPHVLDGTKIRFSQIMIKSPMYASSEDQLKALLKLKGIVTDIADGNTTFA